MNRTSAVRVGRVLAGLVASAACLALAISVTPLHELRESFEQANYWWLIPALIGQLAAVLVRAFRWSMLLRSRANVAELFWALSIGFLATNIFPLRAGEAARALVVSSRARIPLPEVAASIILERMLDLLAVLVLLVCTLAFVSAPTVILVGAVSLGTALLAAFVAVVVMLAFAGPSARLVERLARPLPERFGAIIQRRYQEFTVGLGAVRAPGDALRAIGWSTLAWATSVAGLWTTIEAVVPGSALIEPAFMVAALSIGISVPSSPGFIGVFQFVGQQALVVPFPERFTLASALSIAFLSHFMYFFSTSLLGAIGLLRLGLSFADLRKTTAMPVQPT